LSEPPLFGPIEPGTYFSEAYGHRVQVLGNLDGRVQYKHLDGKRMGETAFKTEEHFRATYARAEQTPVMVESARLVGEEHKKDQVLIVAWDRGTGTTDLVTWGRSATDKMQVRHLSDLVAARLKLVGLLTREDFAAVPDAPAKLAAAVDLLVRINAAFLPLNGPGARFAREEIESLFRNSIPEALPRLQECICAEGVTDPACPKHGR
jgi:hypothetical protein